MEHISVSTDANPQIFYNDIKELDIDEAMEKVGQRNKYQKIVVFFAALTMFFATFSFMVIPYYLSPPTFECFENGEWTTCDEDNGACDSGIQSRLTTDTTFSISTQFDLYCSKRTWRTIIQSTPYFGCIFGVFLFNYISDNKGRAISIKICWTIGSVFSLILNFSSNIPMLFIGSFGLGLGVQSLLTLMIVQCNELSAGKFRVIAVILLYVVWAVNEMQYIWLLKILPNWKWCTFICFTAPFCILSFVPFTFIHDSPRFLYQKNREKCINALNYIANFNKKDKIANHELKELGRNDDKSYSYLDLFRYKSQRNSTIFMTILFISPHILYYGIQVSLDQLGSSFEQNSLFIGIGEFIGYVVSDLLSHKVPRKKGTFFSLLTTCLLCITFYFYQIPESCKGTDNSCWQKPFQSFMAALARCIVSLTFSLLKFKYFFLMNSLMVLLCGETYPTTLKSVGYGFNFGIGFIGSFLSPYIVDISNRMGINPMISLGVLTLSGCVSTLFLKETLNQPMLDEIPEIVERASSRKSFLVDSILKQEDNNNTADSIREQEIKENNKLIN